MCKIYGWHCSGKGCKTQEDKTAFQNYLSALEKWSETKKVKYNKDKCKVLYLSKNQILKYT